MAKEFQAANVPLDGIGVQSHLSGQPQASIILKRLDRLATLGLPIWVTELDYANKKAQQRADVLEDVLTAYFR